MVYCTLSATSITEPIEKAVNSEHSVFLKQEFIPYFLSQGMVCNFNGLFFFQYDGT